MIHHVSFIQQAARATLAVLPVIGRKGPGSCDRPLSMHCIDWYGLSADTQGGRFGRDLATVKLSVCKFEMMEGIIDGQERG